MNRSLKIILAGTILLTGTLQLPAQTPPPAAQPVAKTLVAEGDTAPLFTVTMFDGTELELASLRGKTVLLNFWATWCPPCRAELAQVQQKLIDRFAGQPFLFLPISRGETRETVAAFREKNGYTFPMGLDPDKSIFSRFAASGIPRNFLIDSEGVIRTCEVGYTPEQFEELISKIETLINQP